MSKSNKSVSTARGDGPLSHGAASTAFGDSAGAARHPDSHWRSDRPPPPHNYCLARQKIDWIVEIVDRYGRTFIRNVPFKANSQRKETIKRARVRRYFPVMVQRAGNSPVTSRRKEIKPGENEARPCALLSWFRLGQILCSGFYL